MYLLGFNNYEEWYAQILIFVKLTNKKLLIK
jgi:hypothetical protein